MTIEIIDLVAVGKTLPVDTDHPITTTVEGGVLIIRLEPGRTYPTEVHHRRTETILALSGRFETGRRQLILRQPRPVLPNPAGPRAPLGTQLRCHRAGPFRGSGVRRYRRTYVRSPLAGEG